MEERVDKSSDNKGKAKLRRPVLGIGVGLASIFGLLLFWRKKKTG